MTVKILVLAERLLTLRDRVVSLVVKHHTLKVD
jgi:hypothetical protein